MQSSVLRISSTIAIGCTIAFLLIGCSGLEGSSVAPAVSNTKTLSTAQHFSTWSPPKNLGSAINTDFEELHSAISADGLSLFFSSNRPGGFGGSFGGDIWVAHRLTRNGPWGEPQNLGPKINTSQNEACPELSPDGHWLFFCSFGLDDKSNGNIYAAFRKNTSDNLGWEKPFNLGSGVNSDDADNGDPTIFIDSHTGITTLYFARIYFAGVTDYDIYVSTVGPEGAFRADGTHGTFGSAVLVPELSSPFRDAHPSVRRDGLEIFLSSDRPGSLGGIDLWTSTRRTTHDLWSVPANLGPLINSDFDDRGPYLSDDGKSLLFASNRPGSFGNDDFYIMTREKLP